MKYRKFGNLNFQLSALGFGAMRLPTVDGNPSRIDEKAAISMIRTGIDRGINYVDTAFPYHGGLGEALVGKTLRNGYRGKVKLATKLPIWDVEAYDDFNRILDIQLQRLETECIDLYLIHALNEERWEKTKRLGILKAAEEAKAEGKISHFGFSFHDEYPVFEQILDEYKGWEFCQIQYNFMDVDYQAGLKGLREAHRRGLAVIVMEPLKGGLIASDPPAQTQPLWERLGAFERENGHVDLSLKWIWDHREVAVVLSGMSTMGQLEQNLVSAEESSPGFFSEEAHALIAQLRGMYIGLRAVDCTGCAYCMPCPSGVNIPRILDLYNSVHMYGYEHQPKRVYNLVLGAGERADNCIECGVCEEVCPQKIQIIDSLKAAHRRLTAG